MSIFNAASRMCSFCRWLRCHDVLLCPLSKSKFLICCSVTISASIQNKASGVKTNVEQQFVQYRPERSALHVFKCHSFELAFP